MKVIYPKHIKKGIFSSMTFQIGPISISIIQLFILALGIAIALGAFNAFGEASRTIGIIVAVPIFIFFVFIAFFEISEMPLLEFIAKLARTYIFDTNKKFQVNYSKPDKTSIIIKKSKNSVQKQEIKYKSGKQINEKLIQDIEKGGLL